MKILELRRWPRPILANAYLGLLLLMLAGAAWLSFPEREWGPVLVVGSVALFWALVVLHRTGPRRLRLEVTKDRLRVWALRGKRSEQLHDLARADLLELWLREIHPVEVGQGYRYGVVDSLHVMARTRDCEALELLLLRDAHLDTYDRKRVLLWLSEQLPEAFDPGRGGVTQ